MGLRVGGLVSGLDTASLVDGLMALDRQPLQRMLQRRASIEFEQSLFRDLGVKLLTLRDAATALDNRNADRSGPSLEEELLAFSATSSNPDLLTAKASGFPTLGTTDVTIQQLARVARHVSTAFASESEIVGAEGETLTIDAGDGSPLEISIGAEGASLVELRSLINTHPDNDERVRAEVLSDGSGYRLVVEGLQTGVENDVSVTTTLAGSGGGAFLDAALSQSAADAQLEVFGVSVTRPSNSFSDVIPGVSLDLRGTGPVQIQVQLDDGAITERLQGFVDAYNDIIDFTTEQTRFDAETGRSGPLSGDATLRGIELEVKRALTQEFSFAGNPFTSLGQIGVSIQADGRLTLDTGELEQALDEDAASVRELLGGSATQTGAFGALVAAVDPVTDPNTGFLATRDDGFERQIGEFDQQIARLEDRLEKREEQLVLQYARLETTLASLQSQQGSLLALVTRSNV